MRLVFDTENDNLLPGITKFHCAGAIDLDTGEEYWFRPHQHQEFLDLLDQADLIIAHNAFGYDLPAMYKLFGWKPKAQVKCTLVMSQVLNFRRFGFGHSLEKWGEFLGDKKAKYTGGFEEFNEDMFEYMKQDVRVLAKVYKHLSQELAVYIKRSGNSNILSALRLEMQMDEVMVNQTESGWLFDKEAGKALLADLDRRMQEIADFVNPLLGQLVESPDGSVSKIREAISKAKKAKKNELPTLPYKELQFTKKGTYHSRITDWFGLDRELDVDPDDYRTLPVWGAYTRIKFVNGDIGNTDTVKRYLGTIGWVPDEWNWKRDGSGRLVKTSAKLTETSLEPLGEVGEALNKYYTLRARKSVLESWLEALDENNRLHGDVFNIGTPTFRQTHQIIANLPSGKAYLGPEIRGLFIAPPGKKIVSADSASCQVRLLAHYMGDPDFTHEVLKGDTHEKNAKLLSKLLGTTILKAKAKPAFFAFLYGAGGAKLGITLGVSKEDGNKVKEFFTKNNKNLYKLIQKVEGITERQGFIIGLDGRPVYVESKHKALNYLIQSAEAIVMKRTVVDIYNELREREIDFKVLLFYHDEVSFEVNEEDAELVSEIIVRNFKESPKAYGVDIMEAGDCKTGDNYFDVH